MEERYHATTQNLFYPDMSDISKNITVEAKLINSPTYDEITNSLEHSPCWELLVTRSRNLPYWKLIALFRRACYWPLFWARLIQSTSTQLVVFLQVCASTNILCAILSPNCTINSCANCTPCHILFGCSNKEEWDGMGRACGMYTGRGEVRTGLWWVKQETTWKI